MIKHVIIIVSTYQFTYKEEIKSYSVFMTIDRCRVVK